MKPIHDLWLRYGQRVGVRLLVIAIPTGIYALHAFQFKPWVVDDAAITFAYARNFAQGFGLVSQPGMSPVEGYSNFAWLLLLSPFFLLNLFDPVATPKLLSTLLIAATFAILYHMLKPLPGRGWIALTAFTLTALNTSFVAWTTSGLENALYVFLVCVLLWGSVRAAHNSHTLLRNGLFLGIIAALVGMTRPDGLAYLLAFPVVFIPARKIGWKHKVAFLALYVVAAAAVYGLFLLFRVSYFGALMPNTYTMKGGPELRDLLDLFTLQARMVTKARNVLTSIVGQLAVALPLLLAAGSLVLVFARRWTVHAWAVLVFSGCSLAIYLLLPPDWMTEYRFATLFFLLFYLFATLIIGALVRQLPARVFPVAAAALAGAALFATFTLYQPRTEAFRNSPTVPMQYVKNAFADRFNGYRQAFGLESASVLLPDVGGMIYYADLTVYDLAGLTDRTIAQSLGQTINRPAFYTYTFETITPSFIHTHAFWTQLARLEDDPRFAEQYVPICAYIDLWIRQTYRQDRQSGDFVRRDIAEAHPSVLEQLRLGLDDHCNPITG